MTDHSKMCLFLETVLLTGYVVMPRLRMYWENAPDAFSEAMSSAMKRNSFEELQSVFHLCDNADLNPNGQMTKSDVFIK